MATTSMQLTTELRDELTEIATRDFAGASLGETVRRLAREHQISAIFQRYDELRADPEEWASYRGELAEWDVTASDSLSPTSEEYPEYNR